MPEMTYREAIRSALREEMAHDDRVFLIGEDIGVFGGSFKVTLGLIDEFGEKRVVNTPISEAGIIGLSLGAAATGLIPVTEIMFADFLTCAMDQIVNQVAKVRYMFGAKLSVPLTIRVTMGGRRAAGAQHSQCLESWFMHVPGLKIAVPSNGSDAKGLLKTAVRDPNPTIVFENKVLYNEIYEIPEGPHFVRWGEARVVRNGSDVTVLAVSDMVGYAEKAADAMAQEGVSVEVIDPLTLVPLDLETICRSVRKTNRLVIAHEACVTGGVGAEIAARVMYESFDYLDAPIERVGAKDSPIPFSPVLEKYILPDHTDIIQAIRRVMR